jgi:hypothetical protein
MPRLARRLLIPLIAVAAFAAIGVAPAAASAVGPSTSSATAAAARADAAASERRLSGHVRRAWPAKKAHRPKTAIGRWLARQVGPLKPVACAKRGSKARAQCASRKGKKGEGKKGASASASMSIARSAGSKAAARTETVSLRLSTGKRIRQLQLIRSFDIPFDDPSYERLLNWSWTYDSAVAATAFSSIGLQEQAGRLLDQLAALQRPDGSIEFAFDVRTGESSASIRAGSVAFAAIAFADYDSAFESRLYLDNARRAADYLLSLREESGLVRGGPDVKWVSTQHNILTLIALLNLSNQLNEIGDESAAVYREAAETIAKGIDSQLIVRDDGLAHFRQGVNDDVIPLDTQALGIIYAMFRDDQDLAKQVYEYIQQNFPLQDRSIELSDKTESYNMTYEAKGPFRGYRPYIGKGAPDVLWFEGTAEMRFVSTFLGQPTEELDASMNSWWDVTRKQNLAPLGADRTITDNPYNEYHVWPTAAAGAWTVLSGAAQDTAWADPTQAVLQLLR